MQTFKCRESLRGFTGAQLLLMWSSHLQFHITLGLIKNAESHTPSLWGGVQESAF